MAKENIHSIVLIDDDPMHNEMLKEYLLQRYKMDIHTFNSGEEALSKIESLKPAYVILDYYLDRQDKNARNGIEILKELKQKFPNIFVVMLSGQDKIEVAVDTMKFGAYDYVIKNASGFIRVETVLRNIRENIKLRFSERTYRFATYFLSGFILLIILAAVILRLLGISTDDIHWF